jgi:hypothetical protein
MVTFKPGDRLLCILDNVLFLEMGKCYIFRDYTANTLRWVRLEGHNSHSFYYQHFILATPLTEALS